MRRREEHPRRGRIRAGGRGGSFAGAARKLGITPVAVSKNVQRLERQLGVRLLQRSTRKLSLTEEGRAYYERCTGPLRELENAESGDKGKRQVANRRPRVTCLSPFGRAYVLPLVPRFSRLYPGIELELHLDDAVSDMIPGATMSAFAPAKLATAPW